MTRRLAPFAWLTVPVLAVGIGAVVLARTAPAPLEAQGRVAAANALMQDQAPATEIEAAPTDAQQRTAVLLAAMSATDAATTVDFSVAIVDHRSGATFSYQGNVPFSAASVVKVDILATLLLQARQEGHQISEADEDLADIMITSSDNAAASTLWSEIGDADGLSAANRTFGLTSTDPGGDGYWGLTTTTATDQVKLLDVIASPTGPLGSANATLLDLMGEVVSDQDWGVSAAARTGETTILKNGWLSMDSDDGLWEVNSIGRITGNGTNVTIAVLSHGSDDLDDGIALVERVAELTRDQLVA
jgi:Beta-lactamase enzyme family